MANIVTSLRMVFSILLIFCPVFSPQFYILYLIAGFSDMIDGVVARKTGSACDFGSKFDSFADFVFVAVCMIKLLPLFDIPIWIYFWIIFIAAVKLFGMIFGYIKFKKIIVLHTFLNKIVGAAIFIFPLTISFVDFNLSVLSVCMVATLAAVWENFLIFCRHE